MSARPERPDPLGRAFDVASSSGRSRAYDVLIPASDSAAEPQPDLSTEEPHVQAA